MGKILMVVNIRHENWKYVFHFTHSYRSFYHKVLHVFFFGYGVFYLCWWKYFRIICPQETVVDRVTNVSKGSLIEGKEQDRILSSLSPVSVSQGVEAQVCEGPQWEVQTAGVRQQGDEEQWLLQVMNSLHSLPGCLCGSVCVCVWCSYPCGDILFVRCSVVGTFF